MKKLNKKNRNVSRSLQWQCNGNCPCPCGSSVAGAQQHTIAGGYM